MQILVACDSCGYDDQQFLVHVSCHVELNQTLILTMKVNFLGVAHAALVSDLRSLSIFFSQQIRPRNTVVLAFSHCFLSFSLHQILYLFQGCY